MTSRLHPVVVERPQGNVGGDDRGKQRVWFTDRLGDRERDSVPAPFGCFRKLRRGDGGLVAGEDIGEDGQGGLGGASAFGKGPQVLAGEEGGHHRHSKLVSGPGLEHGPVCRSTTGLSDGIR